MPFRCFQIKQFTLVRTTDIVIILASPTAFKFNSWPYSLVTVQVINQLIGEKAFNLTNKLM